MKKTGIQRILVGFLASVLSISTIAQNMVSDPILANTKKSPDLKLRYHNPAPQTYDGWEKWSLPLGNSAIGASVFGGTDTERIQLNEKSLWSGGPSEKRKNYHGGNIEEKGRNGKTLKEIQTKFLNGDVKGASDQCDSLVGVSDDHGTQGYGYYLSFGNMYLDFKHKDVQNYSRDLDLNTAIASVDYDLNGTHYVRENFVSYPDNVLVTHLTAKGQGDLDFHVRVDVDNAEGSNGNVNDAYQRSENKTVKDHVLTVSGELNDNQMKYVSHTKVITKDGVVTDEKDKIKVENAKDVLIITSLGTDYKNDYPVYRSGETSEQVSARVLKYVTDAGNKTYEQLKQRHVEDHQSIFNRVHLDLGQTLPNKATNELLDTYKNNTASETERRYLEVLLFQYGRYLTIASSRKAPEYDPKRETLPSNLQGIWVGANDSAWHADYHMNVNLQMNYWPTYSTNMAECAQPLIKYVDSLREPGRVTAEVYAGIKSEKGEANGFMAHTQNNPFGWTCPGWSFNWGWSPAAVPWILQNCWEYYEYTGDKEFLKNNIYPMMKEEAILYDQMLIKDKDGKLVSAPAYSPEHGPRTLGNTYEQSLIWQLYEDTIQAAKILGVDQDLIAKWETNQKNLKGPIEIGSDGQIKEWYEETTLNSMNGKGSQGYGHRHLSHMLGLFPGDLISMDTPEYFDAAKVSMNNRTDESTGWGMGQRINTWARLRDGNKAYKLITDLFKKGILTNLWDTHAPYQIDGNFGYTSGVAEMLLQSNQGYIDLLPALPDQWQDGHVDGLVARGNFIIDMTWKNKKIQNAKITSQNGGDVTIQSPSIASSIVKDEKGNIVQTSTISNDRISFHTEKGKSYTISEFQYAMEGVKELVAYRTGSNQVEVEWSAEKESIVKYEIYRQIEKGEIVKLASTSKNSYIDTKAYEELGNMKYFVRSIHGKKVSSLVAIKVVDIRTNPGMIDNTDSRIQYVGEWGNWTQDKNVNYNDTIQYINNPKGGETITFTFTGTGIEVISCKNMDRGHFDISIDGEKATRVNTYADQTKRQEVIYKKDDLAYGKHTIVLTTVDKKVEFDAFKVLNSKAIVPTSIEIQSQNGVTTVAKDHSTLQLVANITPKDVTEQGVIWTTSNANIATVSNTGLVTFKDQAGEVKITATSVMDASKKGEIVLHFTKVGTNSTVVEDGVKDPNSTGGTKNAEIKYAPDGKWSVWSGEDKHSGHTKTETNHDSYEAGTVYFEYTFTGTGIEVYAQKHRDCGSYDISIDNVSYGNHSLGSTTNDGEAKAKIFEKTNLENKEHTLKCVAVVRDGKYKVNLDFLKVLKPTNVADKTNLQNAIEKAPFQNHGEYAEDRWNTYKLVFDQAIRTMNNKDASQEDVNRDAKRLEDAIKILGTASNKPIVSNQKVKELFTESTRTYITWDRVYGATSYKVVCGDQQFTTTDTKMTIDHLTPKTNYVVKVFAVNANGEVQIGQNLNIKTTDKTYIELSPVKNIVHKDLGNNKVKLTWDDVEGATQYEVKVNGKVFTTKETQLDIKLKLGQNIIYIKAIHGEEGIITSPESIYLIIGDEQPVKVDKSELNRWIVEANKKEENKYTKESWITFLEAFEKAKEVSANKDATQKEVDAVAKAIEDAISGLKENPGLTPIGPSSHKIPWTDLEPAHKEVPMTELKPATKVEKPNQANSDKEKNETPNTGTSTNASLFLNILLGAGVVGIISMKRRNMNKK